MSSVGVHCTLRTVVYTIMLLLGVNKRLYILRNGGPTHSCMFRICLGLDECCVWGRAEERSGTDGCDVSVCTVDTYRDIPRCKADT